MTSMVAMEEENEKEKTTGDDEAESKQDGNGKVNYYLGLTYNDLI